MILKTKKKTKRGVWLEMNNYAGGMKKHKKVILKIYPIYRYDFLVLD